MVAVGATLAAAEVGPMELLVVPPAVMVICPAAPLVLLTMEEGVSPTYPR